MTLLLAGAVVFAGSAVQSTTGSGLALLAAPALALLDGRLIPTPLVVVGLLLQVLLAIRERHALDLHGVGWAVAGYLPGTILGAVVLVAVSATTLSVTCALAILLGVLISTAGASPAINRGPLIAAGTASGFMGTSTGVSGPPMALLYQHAEGPRLRATVASFFVVGNGISLATLVAVGGVTDYQLTASLWLLPWMLAGFWAGGPLRRLVDGELLRPVVLTLAVVAALTLLANAVTAT